MVFQTVHGSMTKELFLYSNWFDIFASFLTLGRNGCLICICRILIFMILFTTKSKLELHFLDGQKFYQPREVFKLMLEGHFLIGWSSGAEKQFENHDKIEEISKDHHLNHRFENYEFDYTVKNYLSDPDINRSKFDVPKSLKMLGILLLNEVTNHIKDHHFKTRDLRVFVLPLKNASPWIPI